VTTTDKNHFYGDPVVYDILHGPGTADEARVLETIARAMTGGGGGADDAELHFLEPACGTARHLRRLAKNRHRCTGFDLSESMVEDAQRRVERAGLRDRVDLFVADMTDFSAKVRRKADAAFNLINTIRHLPTDDAMLAHLEQMAASLKKRGVYIIGTSVTDYDLEMPSEDTWSGGRGACRVTQTVNYLPPEDAGSRTETVLSHIHVATPEQEEHRDSVYHLRTYNLRQWTDLIDRSAMRIEAVLDDLGDAMDPPTLGYALFVLRAR
jgi:SAM-dependent methyltransferase